jgi:hypothetical protein
MAVTGVAWAMRPRGTEEWATVYVVHRNTVHMRSSDGTWRHGQYRNETSVADRVTAMTAIDEDHGLELAAGPVLVTAPTPDELPAAATAALAIM